MAEIGPPFPNGSPVRTGYITLRGVGTNVPANGPQITVLCGDEPPTVNAGYAKWTVVDRPLQTGATVYAGRDPVTINVNLRFGVWNFSHTNPIDAHRKVVDQRNGHNVTALIPPGKPLLVDGWHSDAHTEHVSGAVAGPLVEADITTLEWMAGAHHRVGQPPYVYASSYDMNGLVNDLIPLGYQSLGTGGGVNDPHQWPWVIDGGIQWGTSYRNKFAQRIYQECSFTLKNFMGWNTPAGVTVDGNYVNSRPGADTCAKIVNSQSVITMDAQHLAQRIQQHKKNNPVKGTQFQLQRRSTKAQIPHGYQIWVPSHGA